MRRKNIILVISLIVNLIFAIQLNYYYKQSKNIENIVIDKADIVSLQLKAYSEWINNKNSINWDDQIFRMELERVLLELSKDCSSVAGLDYIPSKTTSELRYNLATLGSHLSMWQYDAHLFIHDKPLAQKDKEFLIKLSDEIVKAKINIRPNEDRGKSFNESLKKIVSAMFY